eukprot:452431-Pyramimonas_sp.AAC.1
MKRLLGRPRVMRADIESTCNQGSKDGSHIDYLLVSETALSYVAAITPVVAVPWKPRIGLLVHLRRSGQQLQARYLDMPRRLPQA